MPQPAAHRVAHDRVADRAPHTESNANRLTVVPQSLGSRHCDDQPRATDTETSTADGTELSTAPKPIRRWQHHHEVV
jgi:hypothetical protein